MKREAGTFVGHNEKIFRGFFQFGFFDTSDNFHPAYFGSLSELADEWMIASLMHVARQEQNATVPWYFIVNPMDMDIIESTEWYKAE